MPLRSLRIAFGTLTPLFITALIPRVSAQDAAPPPPAPVVAQGDKGWVTVPSKFVCNCVFLDATLTDGTRGFFLLDTGCTVGVLDERVAARLGLKPQTHEARHREPLRYVEDFELTLGRGRFVQDAMVVKPLDAFRELSGENLLGILGGEFFDEHSVRIEYGTRSVSIRPAADDFEIEKLTPIPFTYGSGTVPFVTILVRARGGPLTGGYAYMDLGFTGAFQAPEKSARRYRIAFDAGAPGGRAQTMDGVERHAEAEVETLAIGPFEFRTVEALVPLGGDPDQILIGSEVWSRFETLVIDYKRLRLLVEPGHRLGEPVGSGFYGFSARAKGEALDTFVADVQAESPAERAGLRTGDVIESIEGAPMSELRIDGAFHLTRSRGRAGESLRLTMRRGEERVEIVVPPRASGSGDEPKPGPP